MNVLETGFIGAAVAMLITAMLNMMFTMIYMAYNAEHPVSPFAHFRWSKLMKLKAVIEYANLAVPLICMVCF